MKSRIKKYNLIGGAFIFIGLPLLFWAIGDFPRRSVLKEVLSVLTIVSFFFMLGQFFLVRSNRNMLKDYKMAKLIKFHKIIAYVFVSILLVHPFLIVVPRYFESGIEPGEAFLTLITTFECKGIVLGLIAWGSMLILGLTSIFRNKLGLKYKAWRVFHGVLSIVFISIASWHVINMGRHINLYMSVLIMVVAIIGVSLLLKTYLVKPSKKEVGI